MQNRNRPQPPGSTEEENEVKANLVRAIKWALMLFGALVVAIALAALFTDGRPDIPFDYEAKSVD